MPTGFVRPYGVNKNNSTGLAAPYWVRYTAAGTNNLFQRAGIINLPGKSIYHYDKVSSTNSIARLMARCGAPEGTIIMSESQTAGKGRRSRHWDCPPGKGLLMSMILRPPIALREIPQLTLLAGVTIAESLQRIGIYTAGIKWPNDILIDGKKVCGILAESLISKRYGQAVIIGAGINVNQDICDLPPDCRDTSTSLKLQTGSHWPRLQVLREFLTRWDLHYQCFLTSGSGYIREKWIQYNHTLGHNVTISYGHDSIPGKAVDISGNGGLLVQLASGEIKEFLADDVSLGRSFYSPDHPAKNNP